jgi:DNA polymerase I-like protein with 3'-5' exonuclease and polymerase domains
VAPTLSLFTTRSSFDLRFRFSVHERSIRNWIVQSTGADILRIACILAARHGIKILAPVHDAVLIEAPIERIEADVARMREIMRMSAKNTVKSKR